MDQLLVLDEIWKYHIFSNLVPADRVALRCVSVAFLRLHFYFICTDDPIIYWCENGYLNLLRWDLENPFEKRKILPVDLEEAHKSSSQRKDLPTLSYLCSKFPLDDKEQMFLNALRCGSPELADLILKEYTLDSKVDGVDALYYAGRGSLDSLNYALTLFPGDKFVSGLELAVDWAIYDGLQEVWESFKNVVLETPENFLWTMARRNQVDLFELVLLHRQNTIFNLTVIVAESIHNLEFLRQIEKYCGRIESAVFDSCSTTTIAALHKVDNLLFDFIADRFDCSKVVFQGREWDGNGAADHEVHAYLKKASARGIQFDSSLLSKIIRSGQLNCVGYLLDIGVKVNQETVFRCAVQSGSLHMIHMLIERGIPLPESATHEPHEMLEISISNGSLEIFEYLRGRGYELDHSKKFDPSENYWSQVAKLKMPISMMRYLNRKYGMKLNPVFIMDVIRNHPEKLEDLGELVKSARYNICTDDLKAFAAAGSEETDRRYFRKALTLIGLDLPVELELSSHD